MDFKKKLLSVAIIATLLSILPGCSENMNKIYNDNKKISSKYDSYTLNESVQSVEKGIFTGDFNITGSLTLWSYDSKEDVDIKAPYNLSVKSGKAKLVLITPDNQVVDLVENSINSDVNGNTTISVPVKKGLNRIKIIGYEQASLHLDLHIDKGEFKKVSFEF